MKTMCPSQLRLFILPFLAALVAFQLGCGESGPRTFKVQGKVTYPDGSPVTAGTVEFELIDKDAFRGRRVNASGMIGPDGGYYLSTQQDGDGAWPGKHRAIVLDKNPDIEIGQRWQPAIAQRYRSYDESGLEFEVKDQEVNQIDIQVTRPGR